jgi:hypothetical protein
MSIALLTLALVGTLMFAWSTLEGYLVPGAPREVRPHFLLGLFGTFLLVMAHSFIMFFLIATGVEMKGMDSEKGWGDSFRRRTVAMKARVFPAMTLALLLLILNFMLGAAAHTRLIPPLLHQGLAWLTLLVCTLALVREYEVLGENNRLIAEAGRRRRADPGPAPSKSEPGRAKPD